MRRSAFAGAAVAGMLAGGLFRYARDVEPANVEVVLPRLAPAFDGYRIVQLSDVHASTWMSPGRVLEAVRLVNAQRPDLVVITGDFATYSQLLALVGGGSRELRHLPGLAAPLRALHALDGVLAVLGNHDHKTRAAEVRLLLEDAGIVESTNIVRQVERGADRLYLCGVDSTLEGEPRLDRVLEALPESGAAVLLAHEPDLAGESAATGRFDLQLSGHTHGGQVGCPPLAWLVAPKLGKRYLRGLHDLESGMKLYVNRGLGSHPRMRFLCRPEISVLDLRAP